MCITQAEEEANETEMVREVGEQRGGFSESNWGMCFKKGVISDQLCQELKSCLEIEWDEDWGIVD